MNAEPYLCICVQRVQMSLPVISKRLEIVKQRRTSMAIAKFQIVPHMHRLLQIVAVVAPGLRNRGFVGSPGLRHIGINLAARGNLAKLAGLHLVACTLLLSLVTIEDSQRNADAGPKSIVVAAALIL